MQEIRDPRPRTSIEIDRDVAFHRKLERDEREAGHEIAAEWHGEQIDLLLDERNQLP